MTKIVKLTRFIILLLTVTWGYSGFAQDKKPQTSQRETERRKMHHRDSLVRSFNKADTSINTLLRRLEQYTTTFNQINNNLAEGVDTAEISAGFPPVLRRVNRIDSLTNTRKATTLRYLFVLRDNLDHLQDQLEAWQADLEDVSAKLIQNQTDLIKFAKDTTLKIIPADSIMRHTFFAHRGIVRVLFSKTDSTNRGALLKVTLLQDKIAIAYTKVLDGTDHIDSKIKKFAMKAFEGESDYLWNTPLQFDDFNAAIKRTVKLNKFLYNYFIKNETTTHLIGAIFFMLICGWIIYIRKTTILDNKNSERIFNQANYIYKNPIISSILIPVAIIPYFYGHPPVVFLETFFLFSIIFTLVLVKKHFHRACFNFLIGLFCITILYGISNLFIQFSNVDRYIVLLLSIAGSVTGLLFLNRVKKAPQDYLPYTGLALKMFVGTQVLAVILNISGRFSLAKIIGTTGSFNLWLLVILFFVVQIIAQGVYLQFQVKKEDKSIINWIDYNVVQKKFRNTLFTVASLLWLFTLLQNLNVDDWIRDVVTDLLNQPRTVVGASFTFGGFVIFVAVIWLSSLLSKVISYFYDVSSQRIDDLSAAKKKNRTSTLLIRLGVFFAGFLLAVAASGFPLEKLTIIISAFGIGIGFGLQNIVNNLVSGVILAFEKPIQIGDIIEVDKRTGTIKEIGIRSSKILTADGSEVIIPNGDLISQHVINWTLSNSNRRVEVIIAVAYGTDILKVKELLIKILVNHPDIMQSPAPSVLVHNFNADSLDFRLLFWADDINNWVGLKSSVITEVYNTFTKEGIEVPQSKRDIQVYFPEGTSGDGRHSDDKTPPGTIEVPGAKKETGTISTENPPEQGP
jgi:potassium efflux system protein